MESQEQAMDVAASTTEAAGQEDARAIGPGSFKLRKLASGANSSLSGSNQHFSAPSSPYFSPRIQSMGQHMSEFTDRAEFQIEASKAHWSDTSLKAGCCNPKKQPKWGLIGREIGKFTKLRLGRNFTEDSEPDSEILIAKSVEKSREVFERLKRDRHPFFKDFDDLVLGEKIAEGGQAEIYEGTYLAYTSIDERPSECVVKVFKRGFDLRMLQSQWPSKLCRKIRDSYNCTGTSEILGGTLLEDGRCAFVLQRYWGDLRTLIDQKVLENGNRGPPFEESVALRILWQIARGMDTLHDNNILHRDLKASNVLLNMYSHGFSPEYLDCYVADFECPVGVVGTGFWRAPEILLALKNRKNRSINAGAATRCTKMADVYSFGMTCYEVLTGRIPFEDKAQTDYDLVLGGQRPELPGIHLREMVMACWDADPWKRPSFKKICETIECLVNRRRWHLTENEFPYYGWRGKEQDASMVRWRWYHPGSFADYRGFYLVPYTAVGLPKYPRHPGL